MTADDLRNARATLGEVWGLGRPITYAEMGRALRLTSQRSGDAVWRWETTTGPTGPASVAINAWLDGTRPRMPVDTIIDQDTPCPPPMTGADLRAARAVIGRLWGLRRPLHYTEIGRLLRLSSTNPGLSVRKWERSSPTGPASAAIEAMLDGARPRAPLAEILSGRAAVTRIEAYAPEHELPDWDDLRGRAPDATGDMSSEAFVRELRDGWR